MLPKRPSQTDEAVEKDAGFGPSHGYPQSHGGPTGPGDAPAKPAPAKQKHSRGSKRAGVGAFHLDRRVSQRAKKTDVAAARRRSTKSAKSKGGHRVD